MQLNKLLVYLHVFAHLISPFPTPYPLLPTNDAHDVFHLVLVVYNSQLHILIVLYLLFSPSFSPPPSHTRTLSTYPFSRLTLSFSSSTLSIMSTHGPINGVKISRAFFHAPHPCLKIILISISFSILLFSAAHFPLPRSPLDHPYQSSVIDTTFTLRSLLQPLTTLIKS